MLFRIQSKPFLLAAATITKNSFKIIKWITLLRERHLLLGNINKYRHTLIHLFKDFKEDLITMKINNQCIIYLINYRKIPQMNDNILDLMLTRLIKAHQYNNFQHLWNQYQHLTKKCKLINYLPDVVKIGDVSIVMKFAHFIVDHLSKDDLIRDDCFYYKSNNQILILYQDENLFRKLIPLLNNQSKSRDLQLLNINHLYSEKPSV